MLFKDQDKERAGNEMEQIVYYVNPNNIIVGSFVINSLGFISDLRIEEEYRGQGYGNKMIAEMVERFGKNRQLTLMVLPNNIRAQHLYFKYGFIKTEETEYYWSMKYEGN